MRVLLVRHAQAVPGHIASSDAERWLTPFGRQTMRGVAGWLAEAEVRVSRIFTSPLIRAVQSAEILASPGLFEGSLEVWRPLAHGTPDQALAVLDDESDRQHTVALIGHEPLISRMAAALVGRSPFPAFSVGAACMVHVEHHRGSFEWMLDPETLTRTETLDPTSR